MNAQYIKVNEIGDKYYYSTKEMKVYHREDGPAVEWADGSKFWYRNDLLHREDGPACEWADGNKSWYINDEWLSEAQFKARTSPHNGKKVTVDGIEYTLTVK